MDRNLTLRASGRGRVLLNNQDLTSLAKVGSNLVYFLCIIQYLYIDWFM